MENLKEVSHIIPKLYKEIEKNIEAGEVESYTDKTGKAVPLTSDMIEKINMVESYGDMKVIAVHQDVIYLGEHVSMDTYILAEIKDDESLGINFEAREGEDQDKVVIFYDCFVVNEAWDVEESGAVGFSDVLGQTRRTI